jgi:hypothetical protein
MENYEQAASSSPCREHGQSRKENGSPLVCPYGSGEVGWAISKNRPKAGAAAALVKTAPRFPEDAVWVSTRLIV